MADEVVRVKKVKKVKKVTTFETNEEAASETGSNYDSTSRNASQGDVGLLSYTSNNFGQYTQT